MATTHTDPAVRRVADLRGYIGHRSICQDFASTKTSIPPDLGFYVDRVPHSANERIIANVPLLHCSRAWDHRPLSVARCLRRAGLGGQVDHGFAQVLRIGDPPGKWQAQGRIAEGEIKAVGIESGQTPRAVPGI